MSKVVLPDAFYTALQELDGIVADANNRKIRLLFDVLALPMSAADFAKILEWDLILITVADRQMAVQFNTLVAYVPNLKFVVDDAHDLFTVLQGKKGKRVWKER
ncbi:MAG: hypothetical protein K2P85_04240 [Flavobacteriaceae bacterium]|nr:hypothetical protein [Flavobacteriaceae bacterium]